jgi:predicted nuclease with TOPRIM domain
MSDPTRYRVANNQAQLTLGGNVLVVDPAGRLVEYPDYVKLRMERIHDLNQIGGLQEENARLLSELADLKSTADQFKAEVERLRKAGDKMASGLQGMAGEYPKALADEWHDAKEGKV